MSLESFVRLVRTMIPDVAGSKPGKTRTRGWWRDHEGRVRTDLVSGRKDDPLWEATRATLEGLGTPRPAMGLADHVEIKLAALMRREGQPSADLVINNVVCGSLNPEWKYTCEKLISKVLRPGQRLTVDGIDKQGRRHRKTYEGEAEQ